MLRVVIFVLLLSFYGDALHAAEIVYYPRPESTSDKRSEYPVKLLELALQKSGEQYQLSPSPVAMLQGRALLEVDTKSHLVNILWAMTSVAREKQALPIRIPIDKGLLGWRLALVARQNRNLLSHVQTLKDLSLLPAGLGHDWPDVEIFQANGLAVKTSPNYELLFRMLSDGQFQYFPRSVAEIWDELGEHAPYGLVVADHVAMHYPAPQYYFVSKDNTKLANAVKNGLERAIADGSFDKLFHRYYDQQIARADFEHRTILELRNPLLPTETPLARKELWFQVPGAH
jgi:hypothetical protein